MSELSLDEKLGIIQSDDPITRDTLLQYGQLISGGIPFSQFEKKIRQYSSSRKCLGVLPMIGAAYRCYTCSYSLNVAICKDCFNFKKHKGHNYQRFLSMGGFCDCGDEEAFKPEGFCDKHGELKIDQPPPSLLENANYFVPMLVEKYSTLPRTKPTCAMNLMSYLLGLAKLGSPMQEILVRSLEKTIPIEQSQVAEHVTRRKKFIHNRVKMMHGQYGYDYIRQKQEFEQICLLDTCFLRFILVDSYATNCVLFFISLWPVKNYRILMSKRFAEFYPYFYDQYLEEPSDRFIVVMSMFSTQILGCPLNIPDLLINNSLMESVLLFIPVPLISTSVRTEWPPIQEFLQLIHYKPAIDYFFENTICQNIWFGNVKRVQKLHNTTRIETGYIDIENPLSFISLSVDLQICILPVWIMLPNLNKDYLATFLNYSFIQLSEWAEGDRKAAKNKLTFNLPLHRITSLLISHQLRSGEWDEEALSLDEANLRLIVEYPLRTQAGLSEALCNKWIRNGIFIKEQSFLYKNSRFFSSFYDPDLFLIQFVCSRVSPEFMLETIIEKFSIMEILAQDEWYDLLNSQNMMEEALFFLAHILSSRVLAGETEEGLMKEEFITMLSLGDKTYAEIIENIPDRGKLMTAQWESFADSIVDEIADMSTQTKEPADRKYFLKDDIMLHSYDPVLARMRCLTLRGYTESLENYFTRVETARLTNNKENLWPPFRIPMKPIHPSLKEFSNFLHSRLMHALIYTLLSECLASGSNDGVLQVTIHILHMILAFPYINSDQISEPPSEGNIYINCLIPMEKDYRVLEPYGLSGLFKMTEFFELSEKLFEKNEMAEKREREEERQRRQPGYKSNLLNRPKPEIPIDQTIISMLLKLYERYAKKIYELSLHKRDDELRIGGGDFFIGEVIDKLVAGSEEVRKVVEDLTGEDDGGAKKAKLDKKKKSAKDKMKKMMEEKRAKAKQFLLESGEAEENVEEEVAEEVEEEEVEEMPICCICNSEAGRQEENPPVYVAFLSKTNILGLRRFDASDKNIFGNYSNNLKIHTKSAFPDLMLNFQWYDQGMLHICGHVMHKNCHTAHMENTMQKRKQEVSEYWCPMCRQLSNTFLPLPHRRKLPLTETPYPDFNLVKEIFDSDQIESSENIQDAADSYRKFLGNDAMLKLNMINLYRRCVEFELIKSSFLTEQNNAVELGASVFVKPTKKIHLGALYRVCNEYLIGENLTEAYQPQIYVADNIEERSIEIVTALVDLKSLLIEAILHNSNGTTGTIKALICFYINLYVIQLLTWIVFCTDVRRIYGWIKNDNLSESDCGFILGKLLEISNEFTHKRKKSNVAQLSKTIISRFSEFLRFCVLVYNSVLHPNEPTVESIDQLEMSDLLSMLIGGQHGNNVTSIRCYFWEDETLQYYLEKYAGSVGYLLNKEQEFKIMKAMMTIHWETPNFVTLPSTFEQFRVSYDSGVRPDNLDSILCLLCGEVNQIVNRETHRRLPTYILLEREVQILLIEHAFRCGNGTCIFVGTANNSTLIIWERRSIVWKSLYVDRYGQEDLLSEEGREMRLDENRLHYLRSLWLYDQFDKLLSESPNLVE